MGTRLTGIIFFRGRLYPRSILIAIFFVMLVAPTPAQWSKVESKTLAWLRAVYFIDEDLGWIGGSKGTLLKTVDGGRSWKQEKKFTDDNIRDLYFSDAMHGWLLCEREVYNSATKAPSYFLKTSDGGVSWQPVEVAESTDRLVRLFFTRDGYGYAVGQGGGYWQMLDDKETWKRVALPVRYLIMGAAFVDDLRGIMVGGGGTALLTTDGGLRWERAAVADVSTSRLNSVYFIDRVTGWAAGSSGKIYVTKDGGKSWRPQASKTGVDLTDIYFFNSKEGVVVGRNGTILETRTGGAEWAATVSGVNSPLERVVFTKSAGFAVGYGGVILTNRR